MSDVIIVAGHPSGQEVRMRIDAGHHVSMDLDDGEKGADCVADVYRLIEGLLGEGIDLEMSDWGTADPDRVKRGGTYFSTGQGSRSAGAAS